MGELMGELPFRGARNQHSHGERAGDAVAAVGHAEKVEVTAPNGSTVAVAFSGSIWVREHGGLLLGQKNVVLSRFTAHPSKFSQHMRYGTPSPGDQEPSP